MEVGFVFRITPGFHIQETLFGPTHQIFGEGFHMIRPDPFHINMTSMYLLYQLYLFNLILQIF